MLHRKITQFGLIGGFILGIASARAQSDNDSETSASVIAAPMEQAPVDTYKAVLSSPGASGQPHPSTPFEWGPLSLYPHFDYTYSYGNGLQSTPDHPSSTTLQTVAPGVNGTIGTHWTFNYSPTWSFYSNDDFSNTFGQSASLALAVPVSTWSLNLSQTYVSSSLPLIVTGSQTTQTEIGTQLELSHAINSQVSISTTLTQSLEKANATVGPSSYPDTDDWSAAESLSYIFSPRLDGSLSLTGDYTDEIGQTELISFGPQARIGYRPDDAFHLDIHGGFQTQVFFKPKLPERYDPLFGTALLYTPFQNSQLTLSLDHSIGFSYLTDQATINTIWSASLQQRLLEHLYFTAAYSGNAIDYSDSIVNANRDDKLSSYNVGLGTRGFLRHGTISISYQVSRNRSSLSAFNLSTHEVALQIGYHY